MDKLGRVEKLLVDADAKTSTGKTQPDGTGANVRGIDQVIAYERNAKGEVTEMKRDNNVDGTYDYREVYILDANGNRLESQFDRTNDGTIDGVTKNTLDAKGQSIAQEYFVQNAEGRQFYTNKDEFTRDSNGNVIKKVALGGDGGVASITTYDVDAQGRTIKAYVDNGGDGKVDRTETYTLDANGRRTKVEYDNDNNGVIDNNNQYIYDAIGNVLELRADTDNDGVVNNVTYYDRDVYGRVTEERLDTGNDGTINQRRYDYEYDANGNLMQSFIDRTGNGVSSDDTGYRYERDNWNNVSKETYINPVTLAETGSNTTLLRDPTTNNVLKFFYDVAGSTNRDYYQENTYDPDTNRLIKSVVTLAESGKIDNISTIDYQTDGSIFRTLTDYSGDGSIDRLSYGDGNARWGNANTDDIRAWTNEQFAKVAGLDTIRLSTTTSTTIHLDAEAVAKLTPENNRLSIWGEANDTLYLEGFTQTGQNAAGTRTYYTATVDDTTYTLETYSAINTVVG